MSAGNINAVVLRDSKAAVFLKAAKRTHEILLAVSFISSFTFILCKKKLLMGKGGNVNEFHPYLLMQVT